MPPPTAPPAPPADAAEATNHVTITAKPARQPGSGLAKRCALGGDPIKAACIGGNAGIEVDAAGTLWVATDDGVRRFKRTADDECRLDPAGTPIAMPPEALRPQPIDHGPIYMRSGGPAWHLVRAGDAIYAYDFLGGLYRIDRGKPEPACVDVFGYASAAARGSRIVIARHGIEQLALTGKGHCKATSVVASKNPSAVFVVGDVLYTASRAFELARYAGGTPAPAAEGAQLFSIEAMTACGTGACVLDQNGMQMVQLDRAGKLLRTVGDAALFDVRPWSLQAMATAPSGEVYVLARHRDGTGDKATCEAAIYRLPAALFEL